MPKRTSSVPQSPVLYAPDLIPLAATMACLSSQRDRSPLKYLMMAIFIVHDALVPIRVFLHPPHVYAASKTKQLSATGPTAIDKTMPAAVEETRQLLLEAAQSGRLDELKGVAELNELKPDTGAAAGAELVGHWKSLSADGTGRDLMAIIAQLLSQPPAVLRIGRDVENNRMFVWPHFADLPLKELAPADAEHLAAINGTADGDRMRAAGTYDGWRLSIGADGVWHRFRKGRD